MLTGRGLLPLADLADLVTEMRPIKHYFDEGLLARQGIEYQLIQRGRRKRIIDITTEINDPFFSVPRDHLAVARPSQLPLWW